MAEKYLTQSPDKSIDSAIEKLHPDKVIVVTDSNVARHVLPGLQTSTTVASSPLYIMNAGEEEKNLSTVTGIWKKLEEVGATRQSVVINIGGGVVTDIGGFAAATYKRGIRTVNYPTTLLGAVDAATGGKTGINFNGLKNEIGAFHLPQKVIISTIPFATLSREEILSGYAEMVKTALICDRDLYIILSDLARVLQNSEILGDSIERCVTVKDEVVAEDPHEKGLRKILNFGHTAGHAFESICIENSRPVTHGQAVAHGILVALLLSHKMLGFDQNEVYHYREFLKDNYGQALMECRDMEKVIGRIENDKKNRRHGEPAFTLLREIGEPVINQTPQRGMLADVLEMYVDMVG